MPSQQRGRVVLVVLGILLAASLWRTTAAERQRLQVAKTYEEAQQLIQQLTAEREQLSSELGTARQTTETQAGNVQSLQVELVAVQERLRETTDQIASLQREHAKLRQENTSLTAQLEQAASEKQALEAKLSSLKELRLAIRDVKQKMWAERWANWRARAQRQRERDEAQLASGNRGYVVKQGKSTLGASPRLLVHVLEPQSQ
ncbi:MAG: hypothetical protein HYT90_00075 [Candidatus Omnitrophica bacterium]|nr:hypothetical protein [Candidatus Omnitrophota bacterium]